MLLRTKCRALIYGTGAVGLWLGGLLAKKAHEVHCVARFDIYDALRSRGIVIASGSKREKLKGVRAWQSIMQIPQADRKFDWVLITVKSYDLAKACEELAHFLPSDTRIVSVQNGIGFEEILTQKFGAERVYYAVITHSLAVLEPGVVTVSPAAGGITFCGHVRTSPLQELMNLFNDLGVQLQRHDDYRNVKWSKLLIGNLGNASSAITDYPSTNLFKNPQVFVPELEAYRECLKVMKAQDIPRVDLPGYPASFLRPMASQLPPWLVYPLVRGKLTGPQMPWSVLRLEMEKARRTSEIDHLNGAVVHFGKKWRVPTPKNEFLCEMMQSIIGDKMPWGTYKHKIDAFSVDFTRFKGR